jgi:hypothetical protein
MTTLLQRLSHVLPCRAALACCLHPRRVESGMGSNSAIRAKTIAKSQTQRVQLGQNAWLKLSFVTTASDGQGIIYHALSTWKRSKTMLEIFSCFLFARAYHDRLIIRIILPCIYYNALTELATARDAPAI